MGAGIDIGMDRLAPAHGKDQRAFDLEPGGAAVVDLFQSAKGMFGHGASAPIAVP